MAKRVKKTQSSEPGSGIVKVVDPLHDAPVEVEAQPEEPVGVVSRPGFGEQVRRFFTFLLRLVALLIILVILGGGLYYGLPLLYQRYVVPLDQNTTQVIELQSRQKQTEQEMSDLQTRLKMMESEQSQNTQSLSELGQRLSEIETEISARTQSLDTLEQMQSELQSQNEASSADLQRQISLLKSMELLSRARLFMYQSNFGLARQDVQIGRDLLAKVQPDAPDPLAVELDEVIRRLDLTLFNLPDFPVAASDDLDIAWQILLSGLPPAQTLVDGTPAPTVTRPSITDATLTSMPQSTIEPSATP